MTSNQLLEFKVKIESKSGHVHKKIDRQTQKLLLYLFTSTRGGYTRLRVIMLLLDKPYNTHQLAQKLDLDYKAVQHHVRILEKNNMISREGKKYGTTFCLSAFLEMNIRALDQVIDKLHRKMNYKKVYM